MMYGLRTHITVFLLLAGLLAGCSQEPAEIHYGQDECAYCKMMITDNRFAAQLVTETGKAVKFDAIECMARYSEDHPAEVEEARLWVSDFSRPGEWLNLENALLVRSEVIRSPMGAGLLALPSEGAVAEHLAEYTGEQIGWERIRR